MYLELMLVLRRGAALLEFILLEVLASEWFLERLMANSISQEWEEAKEFTVKDWLHMHYYDK